MREIVLDTETTGLDPKSGHKLIEIGGVEVIDRVKTGRIFHRYINPERDVPYEAYCVHKISTEFLLNKPTFKEIASEFLEFIQDSTLIIHNAGFDTKFLNHELGLANFNLIEKNRVIDTLAMARAKFPGAPANLDALCRRFGINLAHRKAKGHGALLDSELLYEVYIRLREGVQSAMDLDSKVVQKEKSGDVKTAQQKIPKRVFTYQDDKEAHLEFIKNITS